LIVNESEVTSLVTKEQQAKEDRIKKGIIEILEFRGFTTKKPQEDDEYIDVYAEKKQEEGDKITAIARFPKNPQIGVKTIRTLGKKQQEEDLDEALLVAESALTHYAKKESVKLGIEIISSSNPLFNIFDHELVPHHIRLKKKEVSDFLGKYQIEKHQIPKILETDPAVKAIQAKPGDVIKIIRNPEMGEEGAYYRVIIKSSSRLRLSDTKSTTKKTATKKTTATKKASEAKKTPTKEVPVKEVPAKKAPVKEVPAKKAPAKEVPVKKAPAKEVPVKKAPAKKTPATKKSTSTKKTSSSKKAKS